MTGRDLPVRVVVVDDDSAQRDRLVLALDQGSDIVVVGRADRVEAVLAVVRQAQPDVVVLGLQLHGGTGQEVIEQLMADLPTPVLVLSGGIDGQNSAAALDALALGAVDALPRPAHWTPEAGAELCRAVRQISKVPVIRRPRRRRKNPSGDGGQSRANRPAVVGLAASTGGPSALAVVLAGLGGLSAPVLVVQHLHPDFTSGLVEWMGRVSALPVQMAEHGQTARPGRVYVAPGGLHLRLGGADRLELSADPVTIHCPSADPLFHSIAAHAGVAGIGVMLTGMGDDGARGLLAIHRGGGRTIAQDEASSAVFGMPRAAQRLGAVTDLLPLDKLADAIQRTVREVTDER